MTEAASIHASAVLVGDRAILIRGASGAGKSRLALDLILAGRARQIPATLLIGDDRVHLSRNGDTIRVRPAPELAGLLEVRGLGLRRCEFKTDAGIGLIVDLGAQDAARLPAAAALSASLLGVTLPRIPVAAGEAALALIVAALTLPDALQDQG